jgi:hypothetical protein
LDSGDIYIANSWQVDIKGTTFTYFTVDPNPTIIKFDYFSANKESKSSAANNSGCGVVNAIKLLEKMLDIFGRNALAGVAYSKLNYCFVARKANSNLALFRIFYGVIE